MRVYLRDRCENHPETDGCLQQQQLGLQGLKPFKRCLCLSCDPDSTRCFCYIEDGEGLQVTV